MSALPQSYTSAATPQVVQMPDLQEDNVPPPAAPSEPDKQYPAPVPVPDIHEPQNEVPSHTPSPPQPPPVSDTPPQVAVDSTWSPPGIPYSMWTPCRLHVNSM